MVANKKELVEEVTFYLYDYSNLLVTRTKKIYSPYNVKTFSNRTASEDFYADPDSVTFKKWVYTAKLKELWKIKFNQQVEWLGLYNPTGWLLAKWDIPSHQWSKNGLRFKNDWIHKVHIQELNKIIKPEVETVTEIKEIQQIPLIVAKNMNVLQLKELAWEWNVELPENILEWSDVEKIQKAIIETMTLTWNIK